MAEGWTEKKSSWGPLESHSLSPVPPCRFFQLGKCIYGENCRYLHELDAETNESNDSCHNVMAVNWVNAPEFIPSSTIYSAADTQLDFPAMQSFTESDVVEKEEAGPSTSQQTSVKSYAKAVDPNAGQSFKIAQSTSELCPYFFMGSCRYGEECTYIHGDLCELCSQHCLHPTDEEQRIEHNQSCLLQHKVDMEKSFAVARSRDKACGICMEIIWEKLPSTKQRFGLLPNCSHCFCLDCIRKWRQEKQFENKIIRSCPECRVQSDFVCPSRYWCETKEEKEKLITDYKGALRYFFLFLFKNNLCLNGRGKIMWMRHIWKPVPQGCCLLRQEKPQIRLKRDLETNEILLRQNYYLMKIIKDIKNLISIPEYGMEPKKLRRAQELKRLSPSIFFSPSSLSGEEKQK
ncbi:putative E3 ubiquitin-protein ligase makorin-1 [Daphnia magna]|uniref:RING-type E3 ubiquitin transferase n=1 Tax=Daphnia magna TaxID=35525 RepID=A0A164NAN9_9CRUS|nr:putative E3 ubiquitin-protein ligase makorin-1 [Daphnia magna]